MRGVGSASNNQFAIGYLSGIATTVVVTGALRAAQIVLSNPVLSSVHQWATTPQLSPLGIIEVIFVITFVAVLVAYLGLNRGERA